MGDSHTFCITLFAGVPRPVPGTASALPFRPDAVKLAISHCHICRTSNSMFASTPRCSHLSFLSPPSVVETPCCPPSPQMAASAAAPLSPLDDPFIPPCLPLPP